MSFSQCLIQQQKVFFHSIMTASTLAIVSCVLAVALTTAQTLPTTVSLTKVFDDFTYAITSQNTTTLTSMVHPNVNGVLTDVSCEPFQNSSVFIDALMSSVRAMQVESINRKASIVSNSTALIWAAVTGFASAEARANGALWFVYEPSTLFMLEVDHTTGLIKFFGRFIPKANVDNTTANQMRAAFESSVQGLVNKNVTQFEALFNPKQFTYSGYPEGEGFPIDLYNYTQLIQTVTSHFPITALNGMFWNTMYATCHFLVVDATQLSLLVEPNGVNITFQEESFNVFRFDPVSMLTVDWMRFYWNNISMWG